MASKVVFVNRFYWPDYSATAQILTDIAEHLAVRGIPVTIITSQINYSASEARLPRREIHNGVTIHRVYTTRFGRESLPGRAMDYLSFYASASVAMLGKVKRGDVIVVKSDPPIISVPAVIVARLKRAGLVNWIQDFFPEVGAALGLKIADGRMGATLRWLRNWSLRAAQKNVAICEEMAERLRGEGTAEARIAVIENWADQAIRPIPRASNTLRVEWELENLRFVISYSGNLGRAHMPDRVVELVRRTCDLPGLMWLFIGGGAGIDIMRSDPIIQSSEHVCFKSYQPRERLSESLSAGDGHLIVLDPACDGLIMPSKYYGVRAVNRPIIYLGSEQATIARVLGPRDLLLPPNRPEVWRAEIKAWIADRADDEDDAENQRKATALPLTQWHDLLRQCLDR